MAAVNRTSVVPSRATARAVGALFLTATAAGVLSVSLLGPLDSLSSRDARELSAGALMILVMAAAIAMIPPTLFPVLKQHSEALALGYVVARTVEVVLVLPAAIGPLMVVANGSETVRVLSQIQDVWAYSANSIFFCLSALLLNFVLWRSRLVPRWISGWALVAVVPYLADACLRIFGVSSAPHSLLVLPLALNEMVLAVWLLAKGFRARPE